MNVALRVGEEAGQVTPVALRRRGNGNGATFDELGKPGRTPMGPSSAT
ncbi:hypothetical protein [Cryobacterium adonitolivorans]|nr:hypothetical protein [Cryobacterium adonitolivorans]